MPTPKIVKEFVSEYKQGSAAKAQIRKKSKAAYYKAKETEEVKFAADKAKAESALKLKKFKARQTGGSFFSQIMKPVTAPRVTHRKAGKKGKRRVTIPQRPKSLSEHMAGYRF